MSNDNLPLVHETTGCEMQPDWRMKNGVGVFKMHDEEWVLLTDYEARAGQRDAVAASGAGVPVLTDTMIDAYIAFMRKASYLHHPDVPYHGTAHGDSEDDWNRRLITKALAVALAAAPTPDRTVKSQQPKE